MRVPRLFFPLLIAGAFACTTNNYNSPAPAPASAPAPVESSDARESALAPADDARPSDPAVSSGAESAASKSAAGGASARTPIRADAVPSQAPRSAPYGVELTDGNGRPLRSFWQHGRRYVLGAVGERYRVRIHNPTGRRVEAVVSIDGLDAIDGNAADFVSKRGYIIEPYGDFMVDGFRTSMDDVATFRFSSVADSYAGRKGEARNVGVIGVAFFPEREIPVAVAPPAPRPSRSRSASESADDLGDGPSGAPTKAPSARAGGATAGTAQNAERPTPSTRPGLGTEFGESRESHIQYAAFVRANERTPGYVATLRYNDRAGLLALGIVLDPPVRTETYLRETARPFPNSQFALPPP